MLKKENFDLTKIKEAISTERPKLFWKQVNGVRTPCAVINLTEYGSEYDQLTFFPVASENAELMALPLRETWEDQLDGAVANAKKWFGGDHFLYFYKRYPNSTNGVPCAHIDGVPFKEFFFGGALQKGDNLKPVSGLAVTWDSVSPERLYIPAFAVNPDLRNIGLGRNVLFYAVLMLSRLGIGTFLECNTNEINEQVSGGWSPVSAWESLGFKPFGRLPHYGTRESSMGDGICLYANMQDLSQGIAQQAVWKDWVNELDCDKQHREWTSF